MPISEKKPTAQAAEERYENGYLSQDSGKNLWENYGMKLKTLMLKNPKIYTVTERQGILPTILGRRPASITRVTGTHLGTPDTLYVETPGHGIGVLAEPRKAEMFTEDYPVMQRRFNTAVSVSRKQQGGTVPTEKEQQMQKQFVQFLMQEAEQEGITIQSQEDLKNYIQKLGEEGFKEKQQKFLTLIQQSSQQSGTPVSAKQGSKLNYIKELKGICPEGYLKTGGRCKPCEAKMKAKGGDMDPVKSFKAGRKCKRK